MLALTVQAIFIIYFAKLSDKIGYKRVYSLSAFLLLLFTYPAFLGFNLNIPFLSTVILSVLGAISAGFCAPLGIMIVDAYPTQYRLSGTSISYNVSVALFGGTAPMVASLLTSYSNRITSPAIYIMIWCVISIFSIRKIKDLRNVQVEKHKFNNKSAMI